MKVMHAVGAMLGVLAVLTLGAGAAGNDSPDGLTQATAVDCVNPAVFPGDYRVVHAIWQRPGWIAPGNVLRDSKIWI
ncbi:hypothetical protein [Thioalkalivibrio sp.]|uniref:hypothetical protein n=1 Tax=Thioalkalivibrio sp. TaxID=2093813 RepID=UPI0012D69F32|nr:hypothetical protein [Thioalkalivibrio sp.]TVP78393.1 MAG: hypothetical protein EA346_11450 [Thioalkalivibrio sp.]